MRTIVAATRTIKSLGKSGRISYTRALEVAKRVRLQAKAPGKAYYLDAVPSRWRNAPLVVFEIDESRVVKIPIPLPKKVDFAIMKMPGTPLKHIPVKVLGFLNLTGFPTFPGSIGFF